MFNNIDQDKCRNLIVAVLFIYLTYSLSELLYKELYFFSNFKDYPIEKSIKPIIFLPRSCYLLRFFLLLASCLLL